MDCSKPPCDTEGECCEAKKKQIEDCCKDVNDCLSPKEIGKLKKSFNTKTAVKRKFKDHSGRVKPFSDRSFLKKYMDILYSNDAKNKERKQCAQWKKCILVPYKETDKSCCDGMSGHHIVPSSAILNSKGFKSCYNERKALTVCLLGESNHKGTHGYIHMKLRDGIKSLRTKLGYQEDRRCDAPYSEFLSTAVDSFQETTGNICDAGCIKNDLEQNLKEQCPNKFKNGKDPNVSAEWGNAAASEKNMTACAESQQSMTRGVG